MKTIIPDYKSNHWTEGGTGLTNFPPADEQKYLAAITAYGDENFIVSHQPMNGPARTGNHSLHWLDIQEKFPEGSSAFWKIFNSIK